MRAIVDRILKEKSFCEKVTPNLNLNEDLGLDSLNMVELIVELEEELDIEIEESDLDPASLRTVKQIYDLVEKYTGK